MAWRHEPLSSTADGRRLSGIAALAILGLVIGGAFAGLAWEGLRDPAGASAAFDAYLLRIVRFTVLQAALSTLVAVVPAVLVASALHNSPAFPGRGLILALFAVPLGLPQIVAALGILALLGRSGHLAALLDAIGLEGWPGIYGLSGILVAHAFFNLPLASRLLLEALATIPADSWRLADQLGMTRRDRFRLVEWPAMRAALPGVAALVLMLCFTIVLTLGGGPAATTLEVAIYQALRFDFDPAAATALTIVQVGLTATLVLMLTRLGGDPTASASLSVVTGRQCDFSRKGRARDGLTIAAATLFVGAPLASVVLSGLGADLSRLAGEASVHSAVATSLFLSALAALLSLALALGLVAARRADIDRAHAGLLGMLAGPGAALVLVVPPIVIGAGWFLLLRHTGMVFAFAAPMIVMVNAIMAMPFAVRVIGPAWEASSARHDRLAASLGLSGLDRLRLVDWPVMRRPLAVALAFTMALSLGDLGVVALFGSDSVQTLPYLLLQRMGSYRTADAAGLALFLGLLCLGFMMIADYLGRGRAG